MIHDIKMQILTLLEKENGCRKTAMLCAAFQKSSWELRAHFMALHEAGLARWEAGEGTLILTEAGKKLLADSTPSSASVGRIQASQIEPERTADNQIKGVVQKNGSWEFPPLG